MSILGYLADPLREMLDDWGSLIRSYAADSGEKVVCMPCDIVPRELMSAYGFLPLRIPPFSMKKTGDCPLCDLEETKRMLSELDLVFIVPDMDETIRWDNSSIYCLAVPSGYGEDAALLIHEEFVRLIRELVGEDLEQVSREMLQRSAEEYDTLNRLVRGIVSIRTDKPDSLSQDDLYTVIQSALCLPPRIVADHLALILRHLNEVESDHTIKRPRVMAVGGFFENGSVLDSIEKGGYIVVEDDSCLGRRNFDISYPVSSAGLYEEMIHSLSFRPLCPALRHAAERYELLYRQLGNYGIDLVVFIEDTLCSRGREHMEFLRVRLMRSGIDPLVVDTGSAREKTERYRLETGL